MTFFLRAQFDPSVCFRGSLCHGENKFNRTNVGERRTDCESDRITRLSGAGVSGTGMDLVTALAIIEAHDKEFGRKASDTNVRTSWRQ